MEGFSSNSLGEIRNEKWNVKKNKEWSEEGNERRDSHILAKGKCFWQGIDYDLVDSDVGAFVESEHVIACDPWEIVLDDQLGTKRFALPIML
jgi:hypothetical protein